MPVVHIASFHDLDLLQEACCHCYWLASYMLCGLPGSKMCNFLLLAELTIPQNPDGKVRMDLITQQGIQPPDVSICKDSDDTDWLLGVGGYGKEKLQPEPLKL